MRWVALGLVSACGGGGSDGPGTSDFPRACDERTLDGDCLLFSGAAWTAEDVTLECADGGTVTDFCLPTSQVGTCTLEGGTDFETVTTFYTPFWTGNSAVSACQSQGGSWIDL